MLRTDLTHWQQKKIMLAVGVLMPHVYNLIASMPNATDTERASLHLHWTESYGRLDAAMRRTPKSRKNRETKRPTTRRNRKEL